MLTHTGFVFFLYRGTLREAELSFLTIGETMLLLRDLVRRKVLRDHFVPDTTAVSPRSRTLLSKIGATRFTLLIIATSTSNARGWACGDFEATSLFVRGRVSPSKRSRAVNSFLLSNVAGDSRTPRESSAICDGTGYRGGSLSMSDVARSFSAPVGGA